MLRRLLCCAALLLLLSALPAAPGRGAEANAQDEAPGLMKRLVFRNVTPGVDPASAAGQPRTLYRLGQRYGRLEHPPDPAHGDHALVIVSEPDAWVINRVAATGYHVVDPGPSYAFRATVLTELPPGPLRTLEFGRELAFMSAHGATTMLTELADGTPMDRYQLAMGEFTVVVLVPPGTQVPSYLGIYQRGKLYRAIRYDAYQTDLKPDLDLFRPPPGVKIEPARP